MTNKQTKHKNDTIGALARGLTQFGIVSMALGISKNLVRNLGITGICRNLKKHKSIDYP